MSPAQGEPAVTAHLDAFGRIVSADPALMALQAQAGGLPDGPLAVPALNALVRLALRLQIPISRSVAIGGVEALGQAWVQLRPEGQGVALLLGDLPAEPDELLLSMPAADQSEDDVTSFGDADTEGWSWQVDAALDFSHAPGRTGPQDDHLPLPGEPLARHFILESVLAPEGTILPILSAVARRQGFAGQYARLRADPTRTFRLEGTPLFDLAGNFTGYRGRAEAVAPPIGLDGQPLAEGPVEGGPDVEPMAAMFGAELGRRLDQALRGPLSRIIANAGTISGQIEGPLRQDYVNYAADIATAGRHLMELIDDLADLQAIDRPGFATAQEEVDLADLARRAANLLGVKAAAREIKILAPPQGEQAIAQAEYRRVLQILVNLIGNAVRHSPPQSQVWVRVDETDGRVQVIVADQGNGIDPTDHERIFNRFERLGQTGGEGSGLGLYISRRLARAMGGDVTLDSALGQGARFTLDLPAWMPAQA